MGVALVAMLLGGARILSSLLGDDGAAADAGTATSEAPSTETVSTETVPIETVSTETVSIEATLSTEPVSDEAAGTTVAPTTPVPRVPTAADPARVLIAGDSDAGTFGPYLQQLVSEMGVATTQLDYKVSSGLARPDFFDWPEHFRTAIPTQAPHVLVVTFGGNDSQGLTDGLDAAGQPNFIVGEPTGADDAEWRAEYGRRVGEVMDFLAADGRTLIWVGIPNDDNPDVTAKLQVQDEVVRAEAAERPGVVFIDTWARFSGRDGNWAEYVIDPRDGQGKDVRADDDGFHLNTTGAEILALDIAEAVRRSLRDRGATV